MLLESTGLKIGAFNPLLAAILGHSNDDAGGNVLAEAQIHTRTKILLRDWIYCLMKASSTQIHKRFISRLGQDVESFVETIEESLIEDDGEVIFFSSPMTSEQVEKPVLKALTRAEELVRNHHLEKISESALTLALLENADDDLRDLLAVWLEGKEQLEAFQSKLKRQLGKSLTVEIMDKKGQLQKRDFRSNGRKLITRLLEDAVSIGAPKISTRQLLYTLLGDEGTLLSRSLTFMGIDVKRDFHALLTRELCRPGVRRNDKLELTREFILESVIKILEEAKKYANERDASGILEADISLAFVKRQQRELKRLFAGKRSVDLHTLTEMMEDIEPEADPNDNDPIQQLSIPEIEQEIKKRIRGQNQAIERVMPWIKRLRFGLPRDGRPAGVFLFLGPTGTGKTQLAKELARYVFGDEEMIIFLEMGQFKTKESMNMFIGAPPGYIGYGEGKLTNGLRDNPEAVVLFDEIEKADTQVFDTLLRFADEGMISDPAGPVRDGRRCLIVMTTNAGQTWLRSELKTNPKIIEDSESLTQRLFDEAMKELADHKFRPEFLGRVDERITYLPFTEKACLEIVNLVLDKEIAKFKKLKEVVVDVDQSARELLGKFAHERSMEEGARGAPRAVNEHIVTPIIDRLSDQVSDDGSVEGAHIVATAVGKSNITLEVEI
jgi:ATP-dependent Clp protease ATP-binding subunit ClpC